jgi:hypothetical protein
MVFVPVPGTTVKFSIWDTRVQDYRAYAKASPGVDDSWQHPSFPSFPQSDTSPVVQVDWNEGNAFCSWLTRKERAEGMIGRDQAYRLPTDAEWSVAVGLSEEDKGTPWDKSEKIKGIFPWGTEWPPPAGSGNYADATLKVKQPDMKTIVGYDDGFACTSPVGNFKVNRFGLYDMGGDVWQWCEDLYDGQGGRRVIRGGSWCHGDPEVLLSSRRNGQADSDRFHDIGFRCVLGGAGQGPPSTQTLPVKPLDHLVYQTRFDPASFHLGALTGQEGWIVSGGPTSNAARIIRFQSSQGLFLAGPILSLMPGGDYTVTCTKLLDFASNTTTIRHIKAAANVQVTFDPNHAKLKYIYNWFALNFPRGSVGLELLIGGDGWVWSQTCSPNQNRDLTGSGSYATGGFHNF